MTTAGSRPSAACPTTLRRRRARLGAVLALLAIQSTTAGTIEEVVVSASRVESDASLEALSIARIDAAALQRTGSQHVSQAFFQVPGGWVSRGNGQEHLTAIRSPVFTGPGACGAFLMTEDLVPLRAAGFCNVNQLFDANTEQAERIEVLRGPGTAVYGSNAVHGVINVLTPEPAAEPSGRLGLELGPDQYGRVKLAAHSGGSDQRLLALFNATHDGGYQADSGFKQHKWTLRHASSTGAAEIDSGVSGSYLDQQTAGFIEGPDAYRDGELRRSNPNPEAYREAASLRAWSRWRGGDGEEGWLLTPYLRWNDMEFLQHFLPWKARERNGHWSLGLQSSVHRSWGPDWRLSAGLDLEYTDAWLKEDQAEPFSPALPAGVHYDYQVDATLLAPFLQASWSGPYGTRLDLGLRYERNEYDYDNRSGVGDACATGVSNCRFYRPADRDDAFADLSPRLALSRETAAGGRVWLALTRGFRAPQATELYRLQDGQQVAALDSERADSVELGYRQAYDGGRLELALYRIDKEDYLFRNSDREFQGGGRSEHEGIELGWRHAVAEELEVQLSATYARHRYRNDVDIVDGPIRGNDMDTAPRTLGRAALLWRALPDGELELELLHMGRYYLDALNTARYPGHELVNLRLQQSIGTRWSWFARLLNATDRRYAERADFAFGNERYFVGQPRALFVGMNFGW